MGEPSVGLYSLRRLERPKRHSFRGRPIQYMYELTEGSQRAPTIFTSDREVSFLLTHVFRGLNVKNVDPKNKKVKIYERNKKNFKNVQ